MYGIENNVLEQDLHYAIKLFMECGDAGVPQAYYNLGQMYFSGMQTRPISNDIKVQTVRQNIGLAMQLFEKAAQMGDSSAQFWLAYCFHQNFKDTESAMHWLRLAIDNQHPGAVFYLAMMYRTGDGVEKNFKLFLENLNLAVQMREPRACLSLGEIFYHGTDGFKQDYMRAFDLFWTAAEQGNPDAIYNIGVMYYTGKGVAQDLHKGFLFYQEAAALSHVDALRSLAMMYTNGEGGVERNEKVSKMYLQMAQTLDKYEQDMEQRKQEAHQKEQEQDQGQGQR